MPRALGHMVMMILYGDSANGEELRVGLCLCNCNVCFDTFVASGDYVCHFLIILVPFCFGSLDALEFGN